MTAEDGERGGLTCNGKLSALQHSIYTRAFDCNDFH